MVYLMKFITGLNKNNEGTTLIEIIIAMAITAVLLSTVIVILTSSANISAKNKNANDLDHANRMIERSLNEFIRSSSQNLSINYNRASTLFKITDLEDPTSFIEYNVDKRTDILSYTDTLGRNTKYKGITFFDIVKTGDIFTLKIDSIKSDTRRIVETNITLR